MIRRIVTTILGLGLLSAATGCAPADEVENLSDEETVSDEDTLSDDGTEPVETAVAEQGLGAPSSQYSMPERGGSGGSPVPSLQGAIIYAMRVNTGRLVDQINLAYYVPSRSNNIYTPGDYYNTLGPIGGTGGTWHDWTYCPDGFGAVGIQGRAADKLDAVGLICADLRNNANRVTLTVYGGPGGQGFRDTCQNNYLMTGVNLRAARVVDRIQGICQRQN